MIQFSWIGFNVNVNEDSETNPQRINVIYDSVCIVFFFAVPLIAMIFCYVRIFAVLRQQLHAIKQNNTLSTTREERLSYRRKRRATLIFIGMITMSVYRLLASLLSAQLSARVWKRIFDFIHFSWIYSVLLQKVFELSLKSTALRVLQARLPTGYP